MITTISAPEAVVNYFKDQIREGTLNPGDVLPGQRDLQKTLDISRFSLREGMARLNALGIIRIQHGKGAFVAEDLSTDSLQDVFLPLFSLENSKVRSDLFEARVMIESQAAIMATRLRNTVAIDNINEIIAQADMQMDSQEQFGNLDHKFHRAIAAASGNIFVQRMLDVINVQLHEFLIRHAQTRNARERAQLDHKRILVCIQEGDTEGIGSIVQMHISGCLSEYEEISKRKVRI